MAARVILLLLILSGDIETNPGPVGGKLTPDDLGCVLEEVIEMAANWYRLGLQLHLTTGTLDRIRAQFFDPIDQLLEMLKIWLKAGVSPSWKTLTEALRSRTVGANQLAGDLEAKYLLLEGTEGSNTTATSDSRPGTVAIPPSPVSEPVVSQPAIVATLPGQPTTVHLGPMQTTLPPPAKRMRLDYDTQGIQQICVQSEAVTIQLPSDGRIQTVPQPAAKQRKLDDNQIDTPGIQQTCGPSGAIPPAEKTQHDFGGIQQPSDCAAYQSYCSNIRKVYSNTDFKERRSWPPMGRVKYINLAILKSEKLTVSDNYTLMTIQRSADDIVSKKKRIRYIKLFDGLESGAKILVEGRPGCGKTTLLNKISLDWATGKILRSTELLLLVPLRRFHGKAEVDLDDIVRLYDTGHLYHSVATQIALCGGKGLCIVLDGLDEYPQCSKPGNLVLELLESRKLPAAIVIAASRPAAAHHLRQHATKRVEVLGFLHSEVQQYIEEHYELDKDKLKSLSTYLDHHPNIRHMCYLPLHLAMVVYLNDVLEGGILPRTETGVYEKFMFYTLLRDMQRDSQPNAEHLSDVKQLRPEKLEVFRNICSLAFSATVQCEQIFSRNDVREILGSNEFSLASLGLLTEDKLFCEHGLEETYSFAHLTFQEFLAAYHLTELPAAEQIKAAEEHAGDKHMGVIWKFYCGLTKLSGEVAVNVFRALLQQNQFNPLLLLLSIHESQNQKACCELLSSRNGVLCISDEVLTPADMLAVAYCMRNASASLTEVSFQSCYLGSEELQVLTSECSYPLVNVKHLSLKKTLIRKKVVSSFVSFLGKVPNLESLELPRLSKPSSTGDFAVTLSSLKLLKSLITNSVVISCGGGILHLLESIPALETIRCSSTSLDLEVSREFAKGTTVSIFKGKKRKLHPTHTSDTYDLDLSLSHLQAADAHVIAEVFKLCPRVQKIDLSFNEIGGEGCAALSRGLKECRELQNLHLTRNRFGGEGCAALSRGLKECRELQQLHLMSCSIDDSGATALAECLRSCINLQHLDLRHNSLTDASVQSISELITKVKSLETLRLQGNSFTDASIKSISELFTTVKSLKTLDLGGTISLKEGEPN